MDTQSNSRVEQEFARAMMEFYSTTDRYFAILMVVQWVFAMGYVIFWTPYTWDGFTRSFHHDIWVVLVGGGVLTFLSLNLFFLFPGRILTRHAVAVMQMAMSMLLVYLAKGRTETYFHVFGSLAFLSFYRDYKVLLTATVVAMLGYISMNRVTSWRWLEFSIWLLFADAFLIPVCISVYSRLYMYCARRVQLEDACRDAEQRFQERTAELILTQRELLESQKLEAVGQLASGVMHDFNNLLAVIAGHANSLKEEFVLTPALVERIRAIESSAERGAGLSKKLLDFMRPVETEGGEVNVRNIIYETAILLKPSLNEKIQLSVDCPQDLWTIPGDATEVFQVLMNLAMNSRDAMSSGGKLKISAANVEADEDYCCMHTSVRPGRYVRLTVEDSGAGIPKELQDKIFEPFFTTKPSGGGNGLGLSVVYRIVKSHEGVVSVYSEAGRGTVIHLYFPRQESSIYAAPAGARMTLLEKNSLRGKKVLLADDEEGICRIGTEMLTRYGARVDVCHNGVDAIETVKQKPHEYEIIILDAIMPKVGGLEAYEAMRNIAPQAEFILASGYAESPEITAMREQTELKFIQKPYRAEHLAREIMRKSSKKSEAC
ncbi:MAG: response regulator [Bdellovibrio sp.]|nr:response regulator [Bdellovibrio sp.]